MQKETTIGFTSLLTLTFIILKLTENINWSWWLVLSPTLINIGVYLFCFIVFLIMMEVSK